MQTEGWTELPAWTDAQMAGDPRDGRTELLAWTDAQTAPRLPARVHSHDCVSEGSPTG